LRESEKNERKRRCILLPQKAIKILRGSCTDSLRAQTELSTSLKSVRSLIGKPTMKSSDRGLKKIGTALIMVPTPEPFSDIAGLALIGIGMAAERHKPPLTMTELCVEGSSILKGISNSRVLGAESKYLFKH